MGGSKKPCIEHPYTMFDTVRALMGNDSALWWSWVLKVATVLFSQLGKGGYWLNNHMHLSRPSVVRSVFLVIFVNLVKLDMFSVFFCEQLTVRKRFPRAIAWTQVVQLIHMLLRVIQIWLRFLTVLRERFLLFLSRKPQRAACMRIKSYVFLLQILQFFCYYYLKQVNSHQKMYVPVMFRKPPTQNSLTSNHVLGDTTLAQCKTPLRKCGYAPCCAK
jgi:hypothetical protein